MLDWIAARMGFIDEGNIRLRVQAVFGPFGPLGPLGPLTSGRHVYSSEAYDSHVAPHGMLHEDGVSRGVKLSCINTPAEAQMAHFGEASELPDPETPALPLVSSNDTRLLPLARERNAVADAKRVKKS